MENYVPRLKLYEYYQDIVWPSYFEIENEKEETDSNVFTFTCHSHI